MRLTIPKALGLLLAGALGCYVFVIGPHLPIASGSTGRTGPAATAPPPKVRPKVVTNAGVFPAAGQKFIGIMTTQGPYDFSPVDSFTSSVGKQPEVFEFSQGWGVNSFDASVIDSVADRGMLPMISWEPWNYHLMPQENSLRGYQPAYQLSRIIDGSYDSYIKSWAEGIKGLGYTVAIRFAHEMNGYWYPWGVANGNQPGQYVQAWRHVWDIFHEVGATNVIWVWAPNILWNNSPDLSQFYPGDQYVTWVGLDGYYGTEGMQNYESFNQVFDATIADVRTFTNKPLVITETAATNSSGLAAQWIQQMWQQLPDQSGIIGLIWYEAFDVVDWRITSNPAAVTAFATGYASPQYDAKWSPGMTPLLQLPAASPTPSSSSTP